jgi:16S rRNA (guanine527-N7)-methyltransferase
MADEVLLHVLTEIRRRGGIGPVEIPDAVTHARRYLTWIAAERGVLVDLGSGGGLPGLVLSAALPGWQVWLVERRQARVDLLRYGIAALGLIQTRVVAGDAERWLRSGEVTADVVTARSFAPPLEVLRVARPALATSGLVVVSDPPGGPLRWDEGALAALGMEDLGQRAGIHAFRALG